MHVGEIAPILTVPPAELPVSLAEAKAHLRVDYTDEDTLISAMIGAATAHLDGWSGILGRALVTQTWLAVFEDFPTGRLLRLPIGNVQSATVSYRDDSNSSQTLNASHYYPITDSFGPALVLDGGKTWPSTYDYRPDAVSVTMVCGYGAASAVPEAIKAAIKLIVGDLYMNRETKITKNMTENPTVDRLITPYRRVAV